MQMWISPPFLIPNTLSLMQAFKKWNDKTLAYRLPSPTSCSYKWTANWDLKITITWHFLSGNWCRLQPLGNEPWFPHCGGAGGIHGTALSQGRLCSVHHGMRGATIASCLGRGRGSHSGQVVGKGSLELEALFHDRRSGLDGLVSQCVVFSKTRSSSWHPAFRGLQANPSGTSLLQSSSVNGKWIPRMKMRFTWKSNHSTDLPSFWKKCQESHHPASHRHCSYPVFLICQVR